MYYVLKNKLFVWKNRELQARLKGDVPDYTPDWWDCDPIITKLGTQTFLVDSQAPIPDCYFTGFEFELYSSKLISLIENVKFETFPALLVDRKTKKKLELDYRVFHLLEKYSALDKEKSDIGSDKTFSELFSQNSVKNSDYFSQFGKALNIRKLILKTSIIEVHKAMFRVQEALDLVLINEKQKTIFESENITGFEYIPVDEFKLEL